MLGVQKARKTPSKSRLDTRITRAGTSCRLARQNRLLDQRLPRNRVSSEMAFRTLRFTADLRCESECIRVQIYGPMLEWVQVPDGSWGVGRLGGVAHGTPVKSTKSSKLGCAASRAVKWAEGPINRFSANLMTAV